VKLLGRRSITFRLTVLICGASTLVLLALGIMIGEAVERHFRAQDMEIMTGKVQLARHILEKVSSPEKLDAIPHQLEDALIGHAGLEVVIRPMDGPALFQTQQADMRHLDETNSDGTPTEWRSADGRAYLGTSVRVDSAVAGVPAFLVQVATDISHQESFMRSFRLTLWSVVALAALLTGLAAWYVVRREMRPLQSIREEASAITARHLDQRLSTDAVPAELTQLVETLNEMLGRLEESFRRLTDFSSDLAHELRTPLSNLLTQTQVTLSKARSPAEYQDILASNTEELERLSRMVSDMLFLAQAENSLAVPNSEAVDLRVEAQTVLDFYEALAAEKGIALAMTGTGMIHGDRLMLRRALSNLLSNAVRHVSQDGCIGISVAMDGAVARIAVSNTGETIPPEQLPRLFERFYRADASRQRFADGSGLGLAITQSIVKAHGGSISARSSDGLTVFEMTLPRERHMADPVLDKPSAGS
jgi:two-component system, OmpR family, heavy metal sensor histidine kinase CusS